MLRILAAYRLGSWAIRHREKLLAELLAARDGGLEPVTFGVHAPRLAELFRRLVDQKPG